MSEQKSKGMLTKSNASFPEWFRELELLRAKMGINETSAGESPWLEDFERGLTPNEALRLDGVGEEEG